MGRIPAPRLAVAATVTFYVVAALSMVIANKWVLNKSRTPVFFLLTQLLVAVFLFIAADIMNIVRLPPRPTRSVCKGLFPLVIVNIFGLSFNNYTLKYVDASFYQVARGLVLPLTVLLSSTLLPNPRPSINIIASCAVVTTGFLIGVLLDSAPSSSTPSATLNTRPTIPLSTVGIIFGLFSSLTTALHAIIIKKSLEMVQGNALELAWYSNVLSALGLVPVVWLVGEGPDTLDLLLSRSTEDDISLHTFLWGSAITGVVGFMISIAGFLSIKITSPITHMITSAVRGVIQTFLAMWLFHDIVSAGRVSGIVLVIVGSIWYTWLKNEESLRLRRQGGPSLEGGDAWPESNSIRVPLVELKEEQR